MSARRSAVKDLARGGRQNNTYRTKGTLLAPADSQLIVIIALLFIFGVLAVFSAGAPEGLKYYNNAFYYAIKHIAFSSVGIFLFIFVARIDYRKWKTWCMPVAITVAGLIVATLIPGLGRTELGSSRWLTFLPIQPSELAKLACIILAADALSNAKNLMDQKVIKNMAIIGFMMLIIFKQPNLSMFILLALTTATMMFIAGMNPAILITSGACALPLVAFKVMNEPYQLNRIKGWLDPFADPQGIGYNVIQSWYAIASGGLFGVGFGNSKQKLFWLPFSYADFIFSVISEEFGFIGALVVISLFLALIIRGIKIARNCPDSFGKLLAYGITYIIGTQAFINIGVATGVLPVTGVTLPLISYGGTSMMVTMMMLGILVNISRKRIKKEAP